jgi:EAL domain-containing protein (putative c-di-GMP-specific phosphodiesterase class I)
MTDVTTLAAGLKPASTLEHCLEHGLVRTVFQPIVHLDSGDVVAYEALSRGPAGPLERPDQLFDAARRSGRLTELDELCRRTALLSAIEVGIVAPQRLFINVEPGIVDVGPLRELLDLARDAPGDLDVVLEVTERALSARPAELLATVDRLRADGWKVALDDVGAEEMSLAFMELLRPEVVKLDLSLVQERPTPDIARIMNSVNAYAERSGAVILAEGIETTEHVDVARSLGATVGQGWLLGRPARQPVDHLAAGTLDVPSVVSQRAEDSPFGCLPAGTALRRAAKPLLIEVSKHLEREALRQGSTCVVMATFQAAHHFTPNTSLRYRMLAKSVAFVAAIGGGIPVEPVAGVRGATLNPADALREEWDVVVLAPHFAAALLARDLAAEDVPDRERVFEFALTYDRTTVVAAARALMSRIAALPDAPHHSQPDSF